MDIGAEAAVARRPEALDLAQRCGLGAKVVHPASGAYVWSGRALRPLPSGTIMGIPGDLEALAASEVLPLPALLRVPLDHLLPSTALTRDVALGTYVASRLGRGVVDRLVEPLLGGVYAGHADQISFEAALPELFGRVSRGSSLLDAAADLLPDPDLTRPPVFFGLSGGLAAAGPGGGLGQRRHRPDADDGARPCASWVRVAADGRVGGRRGRARRVRRHPGRAGRAGRPAPASRRAESRRDAGRRALREHRVGHVRLCTQGLSGSAAGHRLPRPVVHRAVGQGVDVLDGEVVVAARRRRRTSSSCGSRSDATARSTTCSSTTPTWPRWAFAT